MLSNTPHYLYRHFDMDGKLLYVGATANPQKRKYAHKRTAPWYPQIANISYEFYPSKTAALLAEKQAIIDENPHYNVIHTPIEVTIEQRKNIMLLMREYNIPDETIAQAWSMTKQAVHDIAGPRIDPPAPDIPPLDTLMSLPHDTLRQLAQETLTDWRAHKWLSQRQAAAMLGVNLRTLQGWEMGKCSLPVLVLRYIDLIAHKNADHGDVT